MALPSEAFEVPDDVARVLDVVDVIPPGRVMTYGDVAAALAPDLRRGPRWVGRVLAQWGGAVPWWRVVRADGGTHAPERSMAEHRREGTPLRPSGDRVDLAAARWRG